MWLFFAILAPICWALANPLDSSLRRNYIKNDAFLTWVSSLAKLPVAIVLLITFSEGFTWGWHVPGMFLTGFLWMLPFIFYYKALQFEETSRVILIMQFLPDFIIIIAAVFIGERLDLQLSMAFVLIFVGSLMAAMRKHESKWHFSRAFVLMALAAL